MCATTSALTDSCFPSCIVWINCLRAKHHRSDLISSSCAGAYVCRVPRVTNKNIGHRLHTGKILPTKKGVEIQVKKLEVKNTQKMKKGDDASQRNFKKQEAFLLGNHQRSLSPFFLSSSFSCVCVMPRLMIHLTYIYIHTHTQHNGPTGRRTSSAVFPSSSLHQRQQQHRCVCVCLCVCVCDAHDFMSGA